MQNIKQKIKKILSGKKAAAKKSTVKKAVASKPATKKKERCIDDVTLAIIRKQDILIQKIVGGMSFQNLVNHGFISKPSLIEMMLDGVFCDRLEEKKKGLRVRCYKWVEKETKKKK